MVFTESEKELIMRCFKEHGWRGAKIAKKFPKNKWKPRAINKYLNKVYKESLPEGEQGNSKKTACTQRNLDFVRYAMSLPQRYQTISSIAEKLKVSRASIKRMQRALGYGPTEEEKEKMLLKSKRVKRVKRENLPIQNCNTKLLRKLYCKALLDKYSEDDVRKMIFIDEIEFSTVPVNCEPKLKPPEPQTASAKQIAAMKKIISVLAGVSWNGKTSIHFFDCRLNEIRADNYVKVLKNHFIESCRRLYPDGDFIFLQDTANYHTSKLAQEFLRKNTKRFVKNSEWPPQSPDINPMNYSIWKCLAQEVYQGKTEPFLSKEDLSKQIIQGWANLSMSDIHEAVHTWRSRVENIYELEGGRINQIYND